MIVAVLCTGPSLTQADVDFVRGKAKVVAVSDAIYLAPWADALVSHDKKWWNAHPEADCAGPKFTHHPGGLPEREIEELRPSGGNSGTLALSAAEKLWKPGRILLLGCDLKGTHFFGPHTRQGLRNTRPDQFEAMRKQFRNFQHLPVVNCSPTSGLDCFPRGDLRAQLDERLLLRATG
jgi:hypothetical protein